MRLLVLLNFLVTAAAVGWAVKLHRDLERRDVREKQDRNWQEVREWEDRDRERREMQAEIDRIKARMR